MITKTTYSVPFGTTSFNTSIFKQFALLLVFGLLSFGGFGQTTETIILDQPGKGTFVAPCEVTKIFVEVWGAGSAGGGSRSNSHGGTEGKAGLYTSGTYSFSNSIAGITFDYDIGEGGKGSSTSRTTFIGGRWGTDFSIGANNDSNPGLATAISGPSTTAKDGTNAPNGIGEGGKGNINGDGFAGGIASGGGGGTGINAKGGDGGDGYIRITMTYADNGLSDYCTARFNNVVPITQVIFAGIDNISTDEDEENELFCTEIGTVVRGSIDNEIIIKGDTDGKNKNFLVAFIDWNQNGVFDNSERHDLTELSKSNGTDGVSSVSYIDVPDDAKIGTTTMRIIKASSNSVNSNNAACNNYSEGQAEDYTLIVQEFEDEEELDDCGNPIVFCDITFDNIFPITQVKFAGIDNTTDNEIDKNDGLERFCDIEGTVSRGSTYEITLKGNTGGDETNYFVAYVDWNQNDVFDESTERIILVNYDDDGDVVSEGLEMSDGEDNVSFTADIEIPDDAVLGDTKIRIIKTNDARADQACGNFNEGQAEEYTLIVEDVTCSKTWLGSNGIGWFVRSNWYPKGVPTAESCVYIDTPDGVKTPKIKGYDTNGKYLGIAYANSITISGDHSQLDLSDQAELHVSDYIISNAPINITEESSLIIENGYIETSAGGTIEGNSLLKVKDFELTSSASWVIGETSVLDDASIFIVEDKLTLDGEITLNGDASYIQTSDDSNTFGGSSSFTVNRTAKNLKAYDYVYWSSPVPDFDISGIAETSHRYIWEPTVDNDKYLSDFGNWSKISSGIMESGKGYSVRVGSSSLTGNENTFEQPFNGKKPNNGNINVTIKRSDYKGDPYEGPTSKTFVTKNDDNWNLVGNPYPSAISAKLFLEANSYLDGFIQIWTHSSGLSSENDTPYYADEISSYNASDYITYNLSGSSTGPDGYNGYIPSGQGFFVLMNDEGTSASREAVFTNAMRTYASDYSNNEFYRIEASEESRIWLNLTANKTQESTSMLLGYIEGATQGKDRLYDATASDINNMGIYSLIDNESFIIQGRSLPFMDTDEVALSIITITKDLYSIGIKYVDGLFENNQDFYLEDLYTNTTHDLRKSAYSFTSEAGTFNDRFILRYLPSSTLDIEDVVTDTNFKIIATQDFIKVSTGTSTVNTIVVYDVLGRLLYQANTLNAKEVKLDQFKPTNSPLIVRATLSNGKQKTQKVIY